MSFIVFLYSKSILTREFTIILSLKTSIYTPSGK